MFDPSTEIVTWNGRSWHITDNRLFQARFEKFLNAPEEATEEDKAYRALLRTISEKLAPAKATPQSLDEAFRLLSQASRYPIDAQLCEGIANAVYSTWRALKQSEHLARANTSLEEERRRHEWNLRIASDTTKLTAPPPSRDAEYKREWLKSQQNRRETDMAPHATRLAETLLTIKANQAKKEITELQAKIEFQALILQLFLQRRFEHVLIACRFYRNIFTDGSTTMNVGSETKDFFMKTTGSPPTVSTFETLASEAIRDVHEGIEAYYFLLGKNELQSATRRLSEAFAIGEYLSETRTIPREKKRMALKFVQKTNQLISALDVKDYGLAEKLVKELETEAVDFDASKPLAAIETARTVSAMHLSKARNAAVSGDRVTLEAELKAATEIWPRNPALADIGGRIFDSADVQQKALQDFDQLLSQRNYRQIYEDRLRFIAATALYPDRQEALKKVLEDMQTIEGALIRATEIARHGDPAAAWETIEVVFQKFPDDNKLNQARANLTTQAADFVRTLRTAQELEEKGQLGAALAWYLKAQRLSPTSSFSKEGIDRLVKEVIPESSSDL